MGRKVKCKICKKELTSDSAYKVTDEKGKNSYYCNEEEYSNMVKEKEDKNECLTMLSEIFNIEYCPPMVVKELNSIAKHYNYKTIMDTFNDKEVKSTVEWFLDNNGFNFGTVRYVFTIIENNIARVFKQRKKELEQIEKMLNGSDKNTVDVSIMNDIGENETDKKKDIVDISDFL